MREEEILGIMRRIVRDFSPLLPGLRLEAVSPEAFRARIRGKPVLPGEKPEVGGSMLYPLHAFPSRLLVMVDIEGIAALIGREDRRLQRVLAEGMILFEVIYLAASRQPLPDPRGRAESILRRHWPFQYTAVRCAGFIAERRTGTGLAGDHVRDT